MNIVIINSVCGVGSTGRICYEIADKFSEQGHNVRIAFGRNKDVPDSCKQFAYRIGTMSDIYMHALMSRITDRHGFYSKKVTLDFLDWLEDFNPGLIWLHNIHGYYINVELLFNWIKKHPDIEIRWTLHDCWSFTGHCVHFSYVGCDKWKKGCGKCPQIHEYPSSLFVDQSKRNYKEKKRLFCGVKNLTIITPSLWLESIVKQSFLRDYPTRIEYNKIDKSIFRPTHSDFRRHFGIEDKIVILGVANPWSRKKGFYDFIELSKMLNDKYVVVMVGLNDKQIKEIPIQIIGLNKVEDMRYLTTIYSRADVFIKPSVEESYDMTTDESSMCRTKALIYKGTADKGIINKYGGVAVDIGVENLYRAITGHEYCRKNVNNQSGRESVHKIICIRRLNSKSLMSEIYSSSQYYVNPSYEETYPTTNLEALACGCSVITYDVGGSKETIIGSVK